MNWPRRLAFAAALLALVALCLAGFEPPAVVPATAPPDAFSAERARALLVELAREPRPTGSPAHRRARELLLARLAELGVTAEVQRASVLRTRWGSPYGIAHVENLVARLPGADSTGAVALVAHYDSVPGSPGAGDDGAAVAALLETLRALRSGGPLRNDVILLLTDAEEDGLLGAKAFVDEHRWRGDIGVALNFDARGAGGVVAMFETGPGNAWVVRELASAPQPVASSLFYEVARRLPNRTDFTELKRAGIPGLNFAFSDRVAHYHAPTDTVENLDLRSLQHQGSYALSLARRFGAIDLRAHRASAPGDSVYFNTFGGHLVVYPTTWASPIAALVLGLFAAVLALAVKKGVAGVARTAGGALAFVGVLAVTAVTASALVALVFRFHPGLRVMPEPDDPTWFRRAITLLALGAAAALVRLVRRGLGAVDLALGALFVWLVLLGATGLAAPGASAFFCWPLASSLLGLGAVLLRRGATAATLAASATSADAAILVASAAPAVAVAVPGPYLLFVAVGLPMAWAGALAVALVFGLFLPHVELLGGGRSR